MKKIVAFGLGAIFLMAMFSVFGLALDTQKYTRQYCGKWVQEKNLNGMDYFVPYDDNTESYYYGSKYCNFRNKNYIAYLYGKKDRV